MSFFWIEKKVHWGDCDAARIVWFPRFLEWFEEAEEELYTALGHPRQHLLEQFNIGMPRVELRTRFHSPARTGDAIRVGAAAGVENPRRIRYDFEIRRHDSDRLIVTGVLRVACVDWTTFAPRDLPTEVVNLIRDSPFTGYDGSGAGKHP